MIFVGNPSVREGEPRSRFAHDNPESLNVGLWSIQFFCFSGCGSPSLTVGFLTYSGGPVQPAPMRAGCFVLMIG